MLIWEGIQHETSLLRRGSFSGGRRKTRKMKIGGARGMTGKVKRREPLPDNDFKMAPDFRESLGRGQFLHEQHGGGS